MIDRIISTPTPSLHRPQSCVPPALAPPHLGVVGIVLVRVTQQVRQPVHLIARHRILIKPCSNLTEIPLRIYSLCLRFLASRPAACE
jgi:hypothetical protein